jgi:hypothetical protein
VHQNSRPAGEAWLALFTSMAGLLFSIIQPGAKGALSGWNRTVGWIGWQNGNMNKPG